MFGIQHIVTIFEIQIVRLRRESCTIMSGYVKFDYIKSRCFQVETFGLVENGFHNKKFNLK